MYVLYSSLLALFVFVVFLYGSRQEPFPGWSIAWHPIEFAKANQFLFFSEIKIKVHKNLKERYVLSDVSLGRTKLEDYVLSDVSLGRTKLEDYVD